MYKMRLTDIVPLMTISLLLLIVVEVFMTTLFPILGMTYFRLPFHILLVLFLAFNIDTPYLSILVFLIMLIHSLFTVESWAIGTATGVFVLIGLSYVRGLLHPSAPLITILVTEFFLLLWNFISSILVYFRLNDMSIVVERFWTFLPASILISLFSPLLFGWMTRIWQGRMLKSSSGDL